MKELDIEIVERDNNIPPEESILVNRRKCMKTKEIAVLENEVTLMGKTFSVYGTVEEPLFLAKDVANWIEHSNLTAMVSSVDEDEKIISRTKDCLGRENSATFLTENG